MIEAVTAAARTCFVADGYTGTTIAAIAAAAGRTKGTVYHHFADKEALFRAVFIAEQRAIASYEAAAGAGPDPVAASMPG